MFTGIVEELGLVKKIARRGAVTVITIQGEATALDAKLGDSISVNGVCLTIARLEGRAFVFEAIPETMKTSVLGSLRPADKVNLERSLRAGDRIGGHFVTGHVDCVGIIRRKGVQAQNLVFEITFPPRFIAYVLPKGSIAVDGISLTVARCRSNTLGVYVIPHTLKHTTLSFKGPSDRVNLEFDILVKGKR